MYKELQYTFPTLIVLLQNLNNKPLLEHLLRKKIIFTIAELVHNLLLSNIRLSDKEKVKLRPYKSELLELVKKNRSAEYKAQLLLDSKPLLKELLVLGVPIFSELLKSHDQVHHRHITTKVCPAHRSNVQVIERW